MAEMWQPAVSDCKFQTKGSSLALWNLVNLEQVSGNYSYARIFAILKENFPEQAHRFPDIPNHGLPLRPCFLADCSKAETELSIRFRTLEETVIEEAKILFDLEEKTDKKTII